MKTHDKGFQWIIFFSVSLREKKKLHLEEDQFTSIDFA